VRPRLLPPCAKANRGPSMQTPGAGFATPWVLGAGPHAWLQTRASGSAAPQPWGL